VESFDGGRTWVNAGVSINAFCYDPAHLQRERRRFLRLRVLGPAHRLSAGRDDELGARTIVPASRGPDRDMIAVDTNPGSPFFNSAYIGYDEFNFNNAAFVLYSRDGIGTWTKSPKINDSGATIGVNVAVCPDGSIYAFWEDWSARKIWVDRSVDGGTTWARITW
jgi:hypothetical protein